MKDIKEIVAQNILPKVSKQEDIPILELVLDEQTGKAGNITRIEAFIDLVKRKKLKVVAVTVGAIPDHPCRYTFSRLVQLANTSLPNFLIERVAW